MIRVKIAHLNLIILNTPMAQKLIMVLLIMLQVQLGVYVRMVSFYWTKWLYIYSVCIITYQILTFKLLVINWLYRTLLFIKFKFNRVIIDSWLVTPSPGYELFDNHQQEVTKIIMKWILSGKFAPALSNVITHNVTVDLF